MGGGFDAVTVAVAHARQNHQLRPDAGLAEEFGHAPGLLQGDGLVGVAVHEQERGFLSGDAGRWGGFFAEFGCPVGGNAEEGLHAPVMGLGPCRHIQHGAVTYGRVGTRMAKGEFVGDAQWVIIGDGGQHGGEVAAGARTKGSNVIRLETIFHRPGPEPSHGQPDILHVGGMVPAGGEAVVGAGGDVAHPAEVPGHPVPTGPGAALPAASVDQKDGPAVLLVRFGQEEVDQTDVLVVRAVGQVEVFLHGKRAEKSL